MTTKSYVWNHNDPESYSDPSGYEALINIQPQKALDAGHIQIITYDPITMRGTLLSVESATGALFGH